MISCAPAAVPTAASKAAAVPQAETPAAKAAASPAAPTGTPKPAADQPRSGGILKHAAQVDEATFDMHTTGRSLPFEQVGPAYNGLLQYDPQDGNKIIPDLAESYQVSADGKKVTFNLRKNVNWHDGNAFTAEDVGFNFERWIKPPEGVVIARREVVAPVDRIETPDPYTVGVYLKYPSPFFIASLGMPSSVMLPPQYLKDHKTMEYTVLGTGPFKLKKYNRGATIEFVKNDKYFVPGRPYLDGFIQYIIPDETARFAAFRTGQVRTIYTASTSITASHAELLRKEMSDRTSVARFPGLAIALVYLNTTRPPFNDVRVRQAADMVIDRKKILELAEGRGEIIGPEIRGPWSLPDDELMARPGYRGATSMDIEKAKALLAEAGYAKGFQTEAMIADIYAKQTVAVQEQLKAIGIEVTIKVVDRATMEKRYVAGDFAMSVYLPTQPIDDPNLFLSFYVTGGGRNYSGLNDKQIDAWYEDQSRTMDEAKRKEIVLNMQRKILDLAPSPILYHSLYELPYWKCLQGFYPEKQVGGWNNAKRQDVWLAEGCR